MTAMVGEASLHRACSRLSPCAERRTAARGPHWTRAPVVTSIRAANKKQASPGEDFHEARADRIMAAGRLAGAGTAERAEHFLRLRAQSGTASAQHVFRRSLGRRGQFQGTHL